MGAFHSTKISGNPAPKSNGTDISWKFVSKISVHLSRLSFFLEIWKFRKFPVPFGISTWYESAPVPLAMKSYKMAASLSSLHYTGCKIMCHSSSLFLIANSPRSDLIFWISNCGLVVPNFLRFSSLCLHTSRIYFPTRKVCKLLSSRDNGVRVSQVYMYIEEEFCTVCVKFISRKRLTVLETATFP